MLKKIVIFIGILFALSCTKTETYRFKNAREFTDLYLFSKIEVLYQAKDFYKVKITTFGSVNKVYVKFNIDPNWPKGFIIKPQIVPYEKKK